MPAKLTKRISTLRLTKNDYDSLEKLLRQKKKIMGIRGENLTLPDIVRDAIDHFIA